MVDKRVVRFFMVAFVLALCCIKLASAGSSWGARSAEKVRDAIAGKDCAGAVEELNRGLSKEYPEVQLLAGSMFEEGVCVKADWDRAVELYVRAKAGEEAGATYRLAAGYAVPGARRDIAAALWWFNQSSEPISKACAVSSAARENPDRFVEEIKQWTAAKLEACNYTVGVMSMLAGYMAFPDVLNRANVSGVLMVKFRPAERQLEIKDQGHVDFIFSRSAAPRLDRNGRPADKAFENMMRDLFEAALKRYPQPEGIDPAIESQIRFLFVP